MQIEAPIKDSKVDWPKYRYWIGEEREYSTSFPIDEQIQGKGYGGMGVELPFGWWVNIREGHVREATYDIYDHPEIIEEIFQWYTERSRNEVKAAIKAQPRAVLDGYIIQGSLDSLSYSSLAFFQKYDLPFLKKITRLTKEAGIPSHLHVCGRSFVIVQLCYQETDLDIIEPLEPTPVGDCDLEEVKTKFGDKLIIKGNLNTFDLLAHGTPYYPFLYRASQ